MINKTSVALGLVLGLTACGAPNTKPVAALQETVVSGEDTVADVVPVAITGLLSAPVAEGMARVVVFRARAFGLTPIKPKVKFNNQAVGICDQKSVLVEDVAPGTYDVSIRTDIVAKKTVTIAAGQTAYLKCGTLLIGILLPAPSLEIVERSDIPERVLSLPKQ